jgi:hypothetical protein
MDKPQVLLLVIVLILVLLITKEHQTNKRLRLERIKEDFRYMTASEVAQKVQVAIELYNAYKEYLPMIKEYLKYFKDKRKLKADICKWSQDKTLLKALAYLLSKISIKLTKPAQKEALDKIVKLIYKLNVLAVAFAAIPSFIFDVVPQPHKSNLKLFLDINGFTAKMLRQLLGLGDDCGVYEEPTSVDVTGIQVIDDSELPTPDSVTFDFSEYDTNTEV